MRPQRSAGRFTVPVPTHDNSQPSHSRTTANGRPIRPRQNDELTRHEKAARLAFSLGSYLLCFAGLIFLAMCAGVAETGAHNAAVTDASKDRAVWWFVTRLALGYMAPGALLLWCGATAPTGRRAWLIITLVAASLAVGSMGLLTVLNSVLAFRSREWYGYTFQIIANAYFLAAGGRLIWLTNLAMKE